MSGRSTVKHEHLRHSPLLSDWSVASRAGAVKAALLAPTGSLDGWTRCQTMRREGMRPTTALSRRTLLLCQTGHFYFAVTPHAPPATAPPELAVPNHSSSPDRHFRGDGAPGFRSAPSRSATNTIPRKSERRSDSFWGLEAVGVGGDGSPHTLRAVLAYGRESRAPPVPSRLPSKP